MVDVMDEYGQGLASVLGSVQDGGHMHQEVDLSGSLEG